MKKKKENSLSTESIPKIIEIKDQEIEVKKPPNDKIAYYKIVNRENDSQLEEKNEKSI